jgi:hypothetical protein
MRQYIKISLFLSLIAVSLHVSAAPTWRSILFPADWEPGMTDSDGRSLPDFSYAGYHQGESPLPQSEEGVFDVVNGFGADSTGQQDATLQIQSAIDAAQEKGGGVVFIPQGDYLLLGGLKVSKSGVVIRGAGPERTRLFFKDHASERMNGVTIGGFFKAGAETPLAADAAKNAQSLLFEDASEFEEGDDIDVGWIITDGFVEEHGMKGTWKAHNGKWMTFFRLNVVSIDRSTQPNRVEVDVPLRYPVKIRDGATVRRRTKYIQECGIEDLSMSNPMPADMVDRLPEKVRRQLIQIHDAKNCWVRNVHSFAPVGEEYDSKYHLYDKGIVISKSKRLTIQDCVLQYAQRRDKGGHGYLYELGGSNDILIKDCKGIGGRHNYTSNWLFGSVGNVFLRCLTREGSQSDWNNNLGPSDFHHSLAMAALIDSCTIDDGWLAMNRGAMSGGAGHTVTESVFWNCGGIGEIRSAQYGWGYLIGLADSLEVVTEVDLSKGSLNWLEKQYVGTEPFDFVEGRGRGATLEPQSLYEAQLNLRLNGSMAVAPEKIADVAVADEPEQTPSPAISTEPVSFSLRQVMLFSAGALLILFLVVQLLGRKSKS